MINTTVSLIPVYGVGETNGFQIVDFRFQIEEFSIYDLQS